MDLKVDCYILRIKAREAWFSWPFLCEPNPSNITDKVICKGLEKFLINAPFTIDEINEIRVEKKTFEVKKQGD
ncbi:MAG: hypothetical protein DRO40_09990 [Thermoprotei archaeon]|nr:MAG: hypothetical protein DRO40_09990 [Thermoprotei archaeon]